MDKDKSKEEENFIKQNPIFFNKYKLEKKLAEGAFGDVYIGSTLDKKEPVAIKIEKRKIAKPLLEAEAYFLYNLRCVGIPEVLSFGRKKNYNILVEPLLGKSLFDIFNERRKRMALTDICLIAKQILDRIQWVHSKGYVHRDIKPDNFLIGRKDPNVIYLIDFGLSKKFKSDKTGNHLKFGFTGKLTGTVRFASANALRGGEQSRRDDLESIAYMIIFFMRGKLPWQGVTGTKKMERYLKIYKMKKNVTPEDLCKSLPPQMIQFMKYVKKLEFEQDPDYNYLRNIFRSILKQRKINIDTIMFSWIKQSDLKNLKEPINPATRKDSPQGRIFRQIDAKLKKERNNSSDNDSQEKTFQSNTNILSQADKDENYTSRDEAEIEDNKYKSKKEKEKEGLNTLQANLNKTLDENVNFEETEKKLQDDKQKNKKNYTVNEILDYKNEMKIASKQNKERDKSEEIKINNCNERKMSLIDERDEQSNFEQNKKEDNKFKKIDKNNHEGVIKKENKENKVDNSDSNKSNNMKKILDNQEKRILLNDVKFINNKSKTRKNSDNINLVKKNTSSDKYSDSPEKHNNDIDNKIQKESDLYIKENIIKKENGNQNSIVKDNIQNIIPIQKNSNSPKKFTQVNKANSDKIHKMNKEPKQNKNINNQLNNNKKSKEINSTKDKISKEIKNNDMDEQRMNMKPQKIKIDKKLKKLNIENEDGPMDNNRKKYYKNMDKKIFNTEINSLDLYNENIENYMDNNKIQKRNNNHERRKTPNDIMNIKINQKINNLDNKKYKKFKKNISTYENDQMINLALLPQNSDEIDNNLNKNTNNNFNDDNSKLTNLSNSVKIIKNKNENLYNNINIINNINDNINMNSNTNLENKNENNNFIKDGYQNINNNNLGSNKNINENLKHIENNANRKIRIVNRNKNPNKLINPYTDINKSNSKNNSQYNTFSNMISNNSIRQQNININNHINNNIIINNKISQPINSYLRSNSNNPYPAQNMNLMNPHPYTLNKRGSHNINIDRINNTYNLPINNMNQIQYMKRPSYNNNKINLNNGLNQMNQIILDKRPSYNQKFSVSNCLNNTEPNNMSKGMGITKVKKLTNKTNLDNHINYNGKYIKIVRDNRDITNRGGFGQNLEKHLNNTFENNMPINNMLLNPYNNISNNNIVVNNITKKNNSTKIRILPEKIQIKQFTNNNPQPNQNFGNNKIFIEKLPNYPTNYTENYQNHQFDSNEQNYGFDNF